MQSRRMSLVEALVNTVGGFAIALWAQVYLFKWYGIYTGLQHSLEIAMIMFAISLVRQYTFRRFFVWLHHRRERRCVGGMPKEARELYEFLKGAQWTEEELTRFSQR